MKMKKTFTAFCLALACTSGLRAQEFNLFHDVDADGWLWFDTQEKIDKYVGLCNEADNKIDPNGKPIQMVPADIAPDYPATFADALWQGAGTDKEIGTEGSRTGAIVTAAASANMTANGGGFVVLMPSCSTYGICLSREGSTYVRMMASKDINTVFTNYDVISAKFTTVFKPLFRGGIYNWTEIETLDNGNEGAYTLQSDKPVYAYFQSLTKEPIYIHGIRVTTPTNSTVDIRETVAPKSRIFFEGSRVVLTEPADIKIYNANGVLMNTAHTDRMDLSSMPKGIYVVKAGDAVRKMVLR